MSPWTCEVCGEVIDYGETLIQLVTVKDHADAHTPSELRARITELKASRDMWRDLYDKAAAPLKA